MIDKVKDCPICDGEISHCYSGSSDWDFACYVCDYSINIWVRAKDEENENQLAIDKWNNFEWPELFRDKMIYRTLLKKKFWEMLGNLDLEGNEMLDKLEQNISLTGWDYL